MAPPPLVDIGVNLAHKSFRADRESVVSRALAAGVTTLILTGTSEAGSREAQAIAASFAARDAHAKAGLFSTAGVHPHDAKSCGPSTLDALREIARRPRV